MEVEKERLENESKQKPVEGVRDVKQYVIDQKE